MIRKLSRLVRCVKSLGLRLGWKYWRIESKALVNPWLVLQWADNCEREAEHLNAKDEKLIADAHRAWALELRKTYLRWLCASALSVSPSLNK